MNTDEALAIIERNTPCAHENYEVAGFNFRKCSDCGAMVANERADRAVQGARAYEDACGTLRAELARLREIERCADVLADDPGSLAKQDNARAALTPSRTDPPAAWHGSIPHEPNEDK